MRFKFLVLLFPFVFTVSLNAQTIHPFAIEVANAEYGPFTKIGTTVKFWVNTGNYNFVRFPEEQDLILTDKTSGEDLFLRADSLIAAWKAESERMAGRGRLRFSSRMEDGNTIGQAENARDTTGFIFEMEALAAPSKDSKSLNLKGTIVYFESGEGQLETTVDIPNLRAHAEKFEVIDLNGKQLTFRLTGVKAYGTDFEYKPELEGSHITGLSLDGANWNSILYVKDEIGTKPMTLYIKAVDLKRKTLDVNLDIDIGL